MGAGRRGAVGASRPVLRRGWAGANVSNGCSSGLSSIWLVTFSQRRRASSAGAYSISGSIWRAVAWRAFGIIGLTFWVRCALGLQRVLGGLYGYSSITTNLQLYQILHI